MIATALVAISALAVAIFACVLVEPSAERRARNLPNKQSDRLDDDSRPAF